MATENLHIPQKFTAMQLKAQIGRVVRDRVREDTVTREELADVLNTIYKSYGDQERQNWLEVERWAQRQPTGGGVTLYDAIIDPILTTADAENHEYPNLNTLVENETWDTSYVFNIGVRNRPGESIVESSATTPPGPFTVVALGGTTSGSVAPWNETPATSARPVWDIRVAIDLTTAQNCTIIGMFIYKSTSGLITQGFDNGGVRLENCVHISDGNVDFTTNMTFVADGEVVAYDTGFRGTAFGLGALFAWNCGYKTANSVTLSDEDFLWLGGTWDTPGPSATLTLTGGDILIVSSRGNNTFSGSGAGVITFNFTDSTSDVYLDFAGAETNPVNVSVGSTIDHAVIKGQYQNVTISGNSDGGRRDIDVTCVGVLNVTGPATVHAASGATTGVSYLLAGRGINARLQLHQTSGGNTLGALIMQDCDDSVVVATLTHNGTSPGSSKPYTIDSNCNRSILIVSGSNLNWGVAGTNGSATTVVITEAGTTPSGAAGGDLSGTYPNPSVVDDSHAHTGSTISALDAGDTTSGTFAIARIPVSSIDHGSITGLGDDDHTQYIDGNGTRTGDRTYQLSATTGADAIMRIGGDATGAWAFRNSMWIGAFAETFIAAAGDGTSEVNLVTGFDTSPINFVYTNIFTHSFGLQPFGNVVTTTNATVTTLFTKATVSEEYYLIQAWVTAKNTAGNTGAAYVLRAAFRNDSGTLTQIGTTDQSLVREDTAGWDATIDNSGTSIRVRVTGAASTTILWDAVVWWQNSA